ncbi:MAG: aminopeptidase P family protein [Anaerolineae bacterium]|nr:aminopeptidase P family protein [Anaerolineae bacterium]
MLKLTQEGCLARRHHLIEQAGVDLLIITNPRHILYLSGLYVTPLALSGWGNNFLLIDTATGETRLIAHNFIEADAKAAHVDHRETWYWYDAATNPGVDPYGKGVQELNTRIKNYAGKRIGVEIGWLPLGVEVTNPVDIAGILWAMRRSKYPDELALIREAVRVIGAGHRAARETIRPGLTELDMYNAVQAAMVREAGGAVLLMGDFASGDRANASGGVATPRVLQPGELMIFDLFPVVNGYRADYTATLSVDGQLSDKQRALETALHEAMAVGESMLKPGSVAGDVYRAVRQALDKRGFAEGFNHHAGHGLGLGHPDAPYFVPNSPETLVVGDVVTLEPGSYGADFGARIENNYLITPDGCERLSQHSTSFT